MTQGNNLVIAPSGPYGMRGSHPNGDYTPTRDDSKFHVFGHSLFMYLGGSDGVATPYTTTGSWLGRLATANGKTSSGSYSFGQIPTHNGRAWPLSTSDVNGRFDNENTSDPWPSGNITDQSFTHIYFMIANFIEHYEPVANNLAASLTHLDNMETYAPTAEKIQYIHWPDAGPQGGANMTRSQFTAYNQLTSGSYLTWHIDHQDQINAARTYNCRSIPVGPVLADMFEDRSYFSTVEFNELYGDDSPHGTENIYLLCALVCYRAIYGENPSLASFTIPASATQMITAVTDNLADIVSYIETRLDYYDNNGVRVY